MATQQNFRTAFNGFNREDVVHYIEYLNSKHTAEINQLNSELEFLRSKSSEQMPVEESHAALEELTAQIQELTAKCSALEEDLAVAQSEKAQLETQLSEAIAAGSEMENMLNTAVAEKDEIAARLETAKSQKTTFESLRDEELQAYRRAERAERKAQERAEQIYRQANGIIADASVQVTSAADQIGQLSENVMTQLAQLQQAVSGSNQALKDAAARMYTIRPEEE